MYNDEYRHGWSVNLNDAVFNKYYKMITGFDHFSVNYNREIITKHYDDDGWYSFTEKLHKELINNNVELIDIQKLYHFFTVSEYDSESIIEDLYYTQENSLIAAYLKSENTSITFNIIKNIMNKFRLYKIENPKQSEQGLQGHQNNNSISTDTNPSEINHSKCNMTNILDMNKCPFIGEIIKSLVEFKLSNFNINQSNNVYNLSTLLAAYDHIILIHDFCKNNESKELIQKYIIKSIGQCEKGKNCNTLHAHSSRQQEINVDSKNKSKNKGNLHEQILVATLNGLHVYLLHTQPTARSSRFTTNNVEMVKQEEYEEKLSSMSSTLTSSLAKSSLHSINFGKSSLEWLSFNEKATFASLYEEIVDNPNSTVDDEIYLQYRTECLWKLKNNRHKQYTLNELMAVKLYTDTTKYQNIFRKAYWTSTPLKVKKIFYNWATALYKAAMYHAIPVYDVVFHGLNTLLIRSNAIPLYNGPISTTTEQSVGIHFCDETGIVWKIKPSIQNKFKFVVGLRVDWICHFKNEAEILLVNQYLPIKSTNSYANNNTNMVNHLLSRLQNYDKKIINYNAFYDSIGCVFNPNTKVPWIEIVKVHPLLFKLTKLGANNLVIHRLVEELKILKTLKHQNIEQLSNQYKLLTSQFECTVINQSEQYCSYKINIHKYGMDAKYFNGCKYEFVEYNENKDNDDNKNESRIVIGYREEFKITVTNNTKYVVYIQNKEIFGRNDSILLQYIYPIQLEKMLRFNLDDLL